MFKLNKTLIIPIFTVIFVFISSCDIIDSVLGGGSTEPDNTKAIDRIEIEYLIDNAKSIITYYNPPPNTPAVDNITGIEFGADITSIAGTSTYKDNMYNTQFNNPAVLGQTIRGSMSIHFSEVLHEVNINISQSRSHYSSIFGDVLQSYFIECDGIPYNKTYIDSFTDLKVDEFYISGSSVNSATANFTEDNLLYFDETEPTVCGNRAFIKVKVHFKS